jgi:hypothetical protein
MTIEFQEFTAKPATLQALLVTEDILDELAAWLGAGFYTVRKTIVGGNLSVIFYKSLDEEKQRRNYPPESGDRIVAVNVGEYIVKHSETVTEFGEARDIFYRAYTQKEIDAFVKQTWETGEVDISAAPYDR